MWGLQASHVGVASKSCEGYRLVMWEMQTSHVRVVGKSCGGCGDVGKEC